MKKEVVDIIIYEVNQIMRNEEVLNGQIEYVLINEKNIEDTIAVVSDNKGILYKTDLRYKYAVLFHKWGDNLLKEILKCLENSYKLGYMSMNLHTMIWETVEKVRVNEIPYKLGLQMYLKYCKENFIDKKTIERSGCCIKVSDIMQYYNKKTNYIKIENGQVQIPQELYQKENEINYISFYIGYDLLNEMLSNLQTNECDKVYDFCDYLAREFIKTDYYKNTTNSTYEMLQKWLNNNEDIIKSELLYYSGVDNKFILETGNRDTTKVALVERTTDYGKDYMIIFNYIIDSEKLEGSYVYYYDNDFEKAKSDFEKVKAGGNLADTFKKNKNKERER